MNDFKIERLSDDVIRTIVAGEIVSTPSCVLKELLENSLDASSSKIMIYLENNGFNLIKVIDDGSGIRKEELEKACLRYSTNRICSLNDLNNIRTYGFRGEALFAIQSISDLEISSKPYDQDIAWKIFFDKSSGKSNLEPSSCINGTTVTARNLSFYSDSFFFTNTDTFYDIYFMFKVIALSKFNVHFILFKDGVEYKNLPPCFDHYSKVKRIEMLGEKCFFEKSFDVNFKIDDMEIRGFISVGKRKKSALNFKFFFVNDRFVNDKLIYDTISRVSKDYISGLDTLYYCLYLYLDPSSFNINLNPKKLDIMFKFSGLYSFISNCLSKVLEDNKVFFNTKINCVGDSDIDSNYNYFLMNVGLSEKKLFLHSDKVLTVLDNMFLFFELNGSVYIVGLKNLRSKILTNVCVQQFLKRGKLFGRKISVYKFLMSDQIDSFNLYKKFFVAYGFDFECFKDGSILIYSVPDVLYNFLINWDKLFNNFLKFLGNSFISHFSLNRFDISVIKIFVKCIHVKSPCYSFELDNLYKELVNFKNNDEKWFLKNCFKVSCKRRGLRL